MDYDMTQITSEKSVDIERVKARRVFNLPRK
jgi:hypothetical protein